MATATKKGKQTPRTTKVRATAPTGKRKPAAKQKQKERANQKLLDAIEEPDRSSPSLAEVDAEALEFIAAIDRFKKENGRPFPSWSEVLLVLRQLGYKRS